ncbi:hypothetical protein [Aurantiacibacter spongiae]|uniref:Uncharacterized protein n=1 Tax=Aurantiacibacter spongiae TaxID=2488860 RepID=A0A3N5CXH3_9SPHN|nr:hypothetical protein [Aurantiacibacter spongiae]RPF72300.1 hypothetical protein EG799_12210 [Aurantiacibacter spongiae]
MAALLLAACQQQPAAREETQTQRIALADARAVHADAIPSPDTKAARWRVRGDGQGIDFGDAGQAPLMTLDCAIGDGEPTMHIIRHAAALPGQSALFPVIGNGMRSRFLADARLADEGDAGEWRWEATLPASDPQLDVFAGNRPLTATLPGRGMLEIRASRIPGEFLDWCRKSGQVARPRQSEDDGPTG